MSSSFIEPKFGKKCIMIIIVILDEYFIAGINLKHKYIS